MHPGQRRAQVHRRPTDRVGPLALMGLRLMDVEWLARAGPRPMDRARRLAPAGWSRQMLRVPRMERAALATRAMAARRAARSLPTGRAW